MGLSPYLVVLAQANPKYKILAGLSKFDKYILKQEGLVAKRIQKGVAPKLICNHLFAVYRETDRIMVKFRARCRAAPKGSAEKIILGQILVQLFTLKKIIQAASNAMRENNVKEAYANVSKMLTWVLCGFISKNAKKLL